MEQKGLTMLHISSTPLVLTGGQSIGSASLLQYCTLTSIHACISGIVSSSRGPPISMSHRRPPPKEGSATHHRVARCGFRSSLWANVDAFVTGTAVNGWC